MRALSPDSTQADENYISLPPRVDNSMKMCASVANNNTYLFTKDSRSIIHLDALWGYHLFCFNWIGLLGNKFQVVQELFHIPIQ